MTTQSFLIYAGGPTLVLAGILLGILIERAGVQRRKTRAYKRQQAQLPRATGRK